ncbi:hypothetical protein BOTBODRAFT_38782 [Botryobasidium botryosum FD-172 SS1]|uniref:RING-type domain-containing protein n=1 Tax=Botryobasidium botryosum (strain FD-172 SS1) TaxID=930990 RepID=A0A067LVV1_BOTB1|nr:hypothetical protein BOTBODRAFT_38782 [Botryobasidium botryosum FD-172 SS1]
MANDVIVITSSPSPSRSPSPAQRSLRSRTREVRPLNKGKGRARNPPSPLSKRRAQKTNGLPPSRVICISDSDEDGVGTNTGLVAGSSNLARDDRVGTISVTREAVHNPLATGQEDNIEAGRQDGESSQGFEQPIPEPLNMDRSHENATPGPSNQANIIDLVDDNSLAASSSRAPPADPFDVFLAQILEIVPDVQPDYVRLLLKMHYETYGDQVDQAILHILLESNNYPKIERPNKKRKPVDEDDLKEKQKAKIDYASSDRDFEVGSTYKQLAINHLIQSFPYVPLPHLRKVFAAKNSLYAPSHLQLLADSNSTARPPPFKKKVAPSKFDFPAVGDDEDFTREREWLLNKLDEERAKEDQEVAQKLYEAEVEEAGEGVECGCCYSEYPFENMVQCPEAHLFCKGCAKTHAETLLGDRKTDILCIDQSGCRLAFPESEIARFLSEKTIALYHRIKQEKELEQAEIEGLESCPFCPYSVVIENDMERLFHCENEECGVVSCRQCKKPDHIPKTCEEMEADKHLDARHKVEEAMSEALMRKCPRCTKPFIKEHGCNKMTCPNCHTLSCYVCRQVVTGYDHFDQRPAGSTQSSSKCPLWDSLEARHHDEVAEAARKAKAEVLQANPDVAEAHIAVDLPSIPATPVRAAAAAALGIHPAYAAAPQYYQGYQAQLQAAQAQVAQARAAAQAAQAQVQAAAQLRAQFAQEQAQNNLAIQNAINARFAAAAAGPAHAFAQLAGPPAPAVVPRAVLPPAPPAPAAAPRARPRRQVARPLPPPHYAPVAGARGQRPARPAWK